VCVPNVFDVSAIMPFFRRGWKGQGLPRTVMPEEEEKGMGKLHNTIECHRKMEGKTVVGFVFFLFHYKLVGKIFN